MKLEDSSWKPCYPNDYIIQVDWSMTDPYFNFNATTTYWMVCWYCGEMFETINMVIPKYCPKCGKQLTEDENPVDRALQLCEKADEMLDKISEMLKEARELVEKLE